MKRQLQQESISRDMRDFASAFPMMQEERHVADYDPAASFEPSGARDLIGTAENAIAAFGRSLPEEQADILALFMVKPRS